MKRARTDQAKDERKQLLLDAALDEFFERGFAAARMDDIAKRANLSKGTLYLYFNSKESLFREIIESVAMPKLAELSKLSEAALTIDQALAAIAEFAPRVIRHSSLPRLAKVLIGESNNFPEIVQSYRENVLEKILAVFSNVLSAAKQRGEIDVDDPELTARLVFAPVLFSGIWHVTFGANDEAKLDIEALFKLHSKILRKALTPCAHRQ